MPVSSKQPVEHHSQGIGAQPDLQREQVSPIEQLSDRTPADSTAPSFPELSTGRFDAGRGVRPHQIAAIQRLHSTHGNQYVQQMVQRSQAKQTSSQASTASSPTFIQRHSSWEHRLLGDAPPSQLDIVTRRINPRNRQHVLETERRRLEIWMRNPESVTRQQIEATGARVVSLRNGLLMTYGESNTLGDYFANPAAIDSAPRNMVLSVLQTVRQEAFNQLTDLAGVKDTVTVASRHGPYTRKVPAHRGFKGAVGPRGETGTVADVKKVNALNKLTSGMGTNQYQALLARNACHFAPESWNRWEMFHQQARLHALAGHQQNPEKQRQAWLANGYADHFLQDSFAAGHLINKTLIMQWFVEWVEDHNNRDRADRIMDMKRSIVDIDLRNWNQIRTMTTGRQPGIAGRERYRGPRRPGTSADPQTAEEQRTLPERIRASGVRAEGGLNQQQAYRNYLAFLNSSAVQAASAAVHNHFNKQSLIVSSPAIREAYQIWGDDSMVTSGNGTRIAAETARMSQQAIDQIIRTGKTSITVEHIRNRFPNMVRHQSGRMLPLEQWNDSLRQLCWEKIFPDVHFRVIDSVNPRMGRTSQDLAQSSAPAGKPSEALA